MKMKTIMHSIITMLLIASSCKKQEATTTTNEVLHKSASSVSAIPVLNPNFGIIDGALYLSAANTDILMQNIAATGAGYFRTDIDWWGVQENNSTTYDWTRPDRVINAARAHGLRTIALITTSPPWARPAGTTNGAYPPNLASQYEEFAYQTAKRYIPLGVLDYELWNEANLQHMDGPLYTSRVLKPGSVGVRRAATELGVTINVLTSGLAPTGLEDDFIAAIYANGGKSYFNNIAYHPYCNDANAANVNGNFMKMQELYNIMVANGDAAKKIWITEFGMTTGGDNSWTEAEQAAFIPQAYNIWKNWSWAGVFIIYQYQNTGTSSTDREQHFGLIRNDGSAKPALQAVKNMIAGANVSIKNRWNQRYLYDDGLTSGQVKHTTSNTNLNAKWIKEVIGTASGDIFRFKNQQTGRYMHTENNLAYVQLQAAVNQQWFSAMWEIVNIDGHKQLKRRSTSKYIHLENYQTLSYAQFGAITPDWFSAQWTIQ